MHYIHIQRQPPMMLDYNNYSAMREGMLNLLEKRIDVMLITLNKIDKDYSPSAMKKIFTP